MNRTQFEHAALALLIQLIFAVFIGIVAGGVAAVFGVFMREYSQVEYQLREKTGMSLTKMQFWHVLKPRLWSLDAKLDWLIPAAGCAAAAYLVAIFFEGSLIHSGLF